MSRKKNFITLNLPQCGLVPGGYALKLNFTDNGKFFNILDIVESLKFKVEGEEIASQSSYYQPRDWSFEQVTERKPDEDAEDKAADANLMP